MSTIKQQLVLSILVENGGNVSRAMLQAGYSPATAKTPQKVTESKGFKELIEEHLPEDLVALRHKELLNSGIINHYEFWAKEIEMEEDVEETLEALPQGGSLKRKTRKINKKVTLTDQEIKEIVESVPGCKLIYIKEFGTQSKTAYFSQPDNRSRKDAIDLAYKLRGSYAPEKSMGLHIHKTIGEKTRAQKAVSKFNKLLKEELNQEDEQLGD